MNSTIPHERFYRRGVRTSWLMATALLALSLGLTSAAFGQDEQAAPPPPQNGQQSEQGMGRHMGGRSMPSVDDQVKHLSKKLNLSADQQAKLKPILEDQRTQMEAIHNDSSLSREDRFSKMQSLRENSDTQIKSLLNDDQQKNFDKMREEQKSRMGRWRRGGENAPATPPAGGGTPQ
jgi:protein CpxP